MSAPKISTTRHYHGEWTAIDENTYDGPGSLMGFGKTEQDAIDDLLEQIEDQGKDDPLDGADMDYLRYIHGDDT
jgi:hypothetical protein